MVNALAAYARMGDPVDPRVAFGKTLSHGHWMPANTFSLEGPSSNSVSGYFLMNGVMRHQRRNWFANCLST